MICSMISISICRIFHFEMISESLLKYFFNIYDGFKGQNKFHLTGEKPHKAGNA